MWKRRDSRKPEGGPEGGTEATTDATTQSEKGYVPVPLECVECHSLSGAQARFWRSYRIDDPSEGEPPMLAFYCPACAAREFGELGQSSEPRNMHW